jgi:phosphatidylinositol alpha-1,6-mannosyltransferase
MRNRPSARLFLAAESLAPGNGGISRLARLMSRVVAEEMRAGRLDVRALALSDRGADCGIPIPLQTCTGSRWRFVRNVWKASRSSTHFLYDFVGMARAHCRLPLLRKPFLTWMCGIEIWEGARPGRVAWAKRADLLLSISEYTRQRADRCYGGLGHAKVCWLGTELDEPAARAPDFGGRPTVLILGRQDPEPWKGHHALIDAWPAVVSAVPDARLVIVGGGPGLGANKARAAASPAGGNIEFRGFVPDDRVEAVWESATAYAMPGVMEGFGLAYIEAMRHGLPVIASVHDAAPEVNLEGVTGYNVDLNKPGELAERIIHLLKRPEVSAKLGQNGKERWAKYFRFSAFRRRFLDILGPWIH